MAKQVLSEPKTDELDIARAREYALLATLLSKSPSAALLSGLIRLRGDTTPIGRAHSALADAASESGFKDIAREYFCLFAGLSEEGLWPYASHYLADTVYGRPLVRLRETLRAFEIEKAPDRTEPEDHIGFLFEVMAGLTGAEIPQLPGADRLFFEKHIAPWARQFFVNLESSSISPFYRAVGVFGRTFIDVETEAFGLASPANQPFP